MGKVQRYNMAFSEADNDIWEHLEQLSIPKAAYIKTLIRKDMYANANAAPAAIEPVTKQTIQIAEEPVQQIKPKQSFDFGGMEF